MAKVGTKKVTAARRQLDRLPVAGKTTMEMPTKSPSSRSARLDGVHTTRPAGASLSRTQQPVPVKGLDGKPLMPTTPWRAAKWIKSGKATPYWSHGVFCVRLNVESGKEVQPIAVGIDPGSKKEAFSVKSASKTYLNLQVDALTWVSSEIKDRRMMRNHRRRRKTPYRSARPNRKQSGLVPAIRSRFSWKIRIANWLCKLFPVDCFVVEDVKAITKGQRRWDKCFGFLQTGKFWFYGELSKLAGVELLRGYETSSFREQYGLKKSKNKMEPDFSAHCVDSWVLANWYVGGHILPDNENILFIAPIHFYRRRLQVMQPAKKGVRKRFGGTRSLAFKRGSIVRHVKYGVVYVGGNDGKRISLHSLETGKRLSQKARIEDCKFLSYNSWRNTSYLSGAVSGAGEV